MATRAVQIVITYRAWDTSANAPKTGDVANHTLRWVKDGTSSAPANSPSEVDATNAKGIYKITMTNTETDCLIGSLCGVSSTANIALFGPQYGFDQIPNAVAGASGGLFIAGTNAATTITTSLTTHLVGTVDTVTTYTGNTPQTGDSFARIGAAGVSLTNLGDTRLAHLDADVSSRGTSNYAGGAVASVTGAVGSVTAAVTVTGTPDVNLAKINGTVVHGDGSATPWGP